MASTVAASQPINRLSEIDQILLVLSGKGGVGKSTVTVELAISLAQMGKNVAILDIDLCGPSIGLMLNVDKQQTVMCQQDGWEPVTSQTYPNIKLMSIAFLLKGKTNNEQMIVYNMSINQSIFAFYPHTHVL